MSEQDPPRPWWLWLLERAAAMLTKLNLKGISSQGAELQVVTGMTTNLPTLGGYNGPPQGILESRDLVHCHPELARRYALVCAEYQARTGRMLFPTRTWSSPAAQLEHYKKGRRQDATGEWAPIDPVNRTGIVTNLDGTKKRGRHNVYPAEAVDSAVDVDPGPGKHVSWDPEAYALLGELADKHGLIWGGRFKGYGRHGDYPHLELPAGAA